MTLRILAIAEDGLGLTLARDLFDRVIVERADRLVTDTGGRARPGADTSWLADLWRDADLRETQRRWCSAEPGGIEPYTKWSHAKVLARQNGIVTHGLGLNGSALETYRAARLAARLDPLPDLVVLCRDTDGRESLRGDMLDGLKLARVDLPFLLAAAHQEAEAWVIAGYCATNEAEALLVQKLRAEHGYDPTLEPHRLTPRRRTSPHDAKRTGDMLFPGGALTERAQRCWQESPLEVLEQRGAETGLPEYLRDVVREVLPLLRGGPRA